MKGFTKFTIAAAALGAIAYFVTEGSNKLQQWADAIAIQFVGISRPTLRNGQITLPIHVQVTNPAPVAVPVSNIYGKLLLFKNGLWQPVGQILPSGPVQFNPGKTSQVFFPVVDIAKINPFTSIAAGIQAATNLLNSGGQLAARIKADITVNIKGFEYTQSAEQSINLNDFLRAGN